VAALFDTVSGSPEEFEVYAAALADGGRAASPTRAAGDGPGYAGLTRRPRGFPKRGRVQVEPCPQGNRVKKFKLRRGLRGNRRPKRRFCA